MLTINLGGSSLSGKVRRERFRGRDYLVAPARLLVSGVLNGSQGALFYPRSEMVKNPDDWNLIPIVRNHPRRNGQWCSATLPGVLEKQGIGFVNRSRLTGKATNLDSDLWFDIAKTRQIDPKIIESLEAGRPLELSTGLFTKNKPAPIGANHEGREYEAIATDFRPDHLAILSDTQGACSLSDGCGVLMANTKNSLGSDDSLTAQEIIMCARRFVGQEDEFDFVNNSGDQDASMDCPTLEDIVSNAATRTNPKAWGNPSPRMCPHCQEATTPDKFGDCLQCGYSYDPSHEIEESDYLGSADDNPVSYPDQAGYRGRDPFALDPAKFGYRVNVGVESSFCNYCGRETESANGESNVCSHCFTRYGEPGPRGIDDDEDADKAMDGPSLNAALQRDYNARLAANGKKCHCRH